ncbi:hypothetical protein KIN20_003875 [Parelaphostrongylus tenuis]|uniref:Thioredoxin-like fold domain-containing protein n=1 Tax=Parelaphostrongylus tenuis TaxID=148309 RepID=A0AAD5MG85_PARTN|nr:hypothetical protein KIN20_003875 [Parelaphostrongylus tenuis]
MSSGLLTEIVSDSLALNVSQEWEEAYLYTPFLNDQALSYEYAECLAAQAFLRIAHLSYFVKQRPNAEFISPTGKIPLLKIRRTLIPEFNGIVDFVAKKGIKLCSHLNDAQIAEMRAHMSIMDVLLRNVEMYVMWKHNDTYSKLLDIAMVLFISAFESDSTSTKAKGNSSETSRYGMG